MTSERDVDRDRIESGAQHRQNNRMLYRVMFPDDDGLPRVSRDPHCLGVRVFNSNPPNDIYPDGEPPTVSPAKGGMSVTPGDPNRIYKLFLKRAMDKRRAERVWCLQQRDLREDLALHFTSQFHATVEPVRLMSLEEYEEALAATRPFWRLVYLD